MTTNNQFLTYWRFVSTSQRAVHIWVTPHIWKYMFSLHMGTYLSESLYETYVTFFLSRPFSSAIIGVYRQCLDECWQCLSVQTILLCLGMSRCISTMSKMFLGFQWYNCYLSEPSYDFITCTWQFGNVWLCTKP